MIAGGVEQMSRAPLVMAKPTEAFPRGNQTIYDTTLGWRFVESRRWRRRTARSRWARPPRRSPSAATCRARRRTSSRSTSQQRAGKALASGRMALEITPITTGTDKKTGAAITVSVDEHPRPETTIEQLAKLKPAFAKDGGTVTAGNASGLNDGAAAVLVASEQAIKELGLTPKARYVAGAAAGVEPSYMGLGPIPASKKVLARAGPHRATHRSRRAQRGVRGAGDPVHRADRARSRAGERQRRRDRVGPPARRIGRAARADADARAAAAVQAQFGLASMCIGVGQGIAVVIERTS